MHMKGVGEQGPHLTLEDLRKMTLEERVAQWPEKWRREGELRGIEQGERQGRREHGREVLRRQAEVRFGVPTAERLSALLRHEDDLHRLDALAETVVRCETADELLREAASGGPGASPNA